MRATKAVDAGETFAPAGEEKQQPNPSGPALPSPFGNPIVPQWDWSFHFGSAFGGFGGFGDAPKQEVDRGRKIADEIIHIINRIASSFLHHLAHSNQVIIGVKQLKMIASIPSTFLSHLQDSCPSTKPFNELLLLVAPHLEECILNASWNYEYSRFFATMNPQRVRSFTVTHEGGSRNDGALIRRFLENEWPELEYFSTPLFTMTLSLPQRLRDEPAPPKGGPCSLVAHVSTAKGMESLQTAYNLVRMHDVRPRQDIWPEILLLVNGLMKTIPDLSFLSVETSMWLFHGRNPRRHAIQKQNRHGRFSTRVTRYRERA